METNLPGTPLRIALILSALFLNPASASARQQAIQVLHPSPARTTYYVSVGGFADDRAECAFLHNALSLASRQPVETDQPWPA